MSATWRQRLAQRRLDLGLDDEKYDYIKTYIESYCKESDERGQKLCNSDMHKTVDQVMNSFADPEFDKFSSGVIGDISRKLGRDDIAQAVERKQKEKDDKKKKAESQTETPETESETEAKQKEVEPIPA